MMNTKGAKTKIRKIKKIKLTRFWKYKTILQRVNTNMADVATK